MMRCKCQISGKGFAITNYRLVITETYIYEMFNSFFHHKLSATTRSINLCGRMCKYSGIFNLDETSDNLALGVDILGRRMGFFNYFLILCDLRTLFTAIGKMRTTVIIVKFNSSLIPGKTIYQCLLHNTYS